MTTYVMKIRLANKKDEKIVRALVKHLNIRTRAQRGVRTKRRAAAKSK